MKLSELLIRETGVPIDAIMLLRHANESVAHLRRCGASVEEFTSLQPIGEPYDFTHPDMPPISVVAVIVDERVYGIYRITGFDAEGTYHQLGSDEYKKFDAQRTQDEPKRATLPCRRFRLQPVPSLSIGMIVRGWEGRARTPVQRHGGGFFDEVEIGSPGDALFTEAIERTFEERVSRSLRDTRAARLKRLAEAPAFAPKVQVASYVFARNPDVVAEVLANAHGICQGCGKRAPFVRRSDGTPFLEVHHVKPLAEDGEDVVKNAVALCPNCHRKSHYGQRTASMKTWLVR